MSLDDIRARAEAHPCRDYPDHRCARSDRANLLAALDGVQIELDELSLKGFHAAADRVRKTITKALQ